MLSSGIQTSIEKWTSTGKRGMEHNRKNNSESQRQGTRTRAFGTSGRINHDASEFYGSKLYAGQEPLEPDEWIENSIPTENLDRFYCASSAQMSEIPDASVHLMVTSPPYNAKKEYDDDLSLAECRELLHAVFAEPPKPVSYTHLTLPTTPYV